MCSRLCATTGAPGSPCSFSAWQHSPRGSRSAMRRSVPGQRLPAPWMPFQGWSAAPCHAAIQGGEAESCSWFSPARQRFPGLTQPQAAPGQALAALLRGNPWQPQGDALRRQTRALCLQKRFSGDEFLPRSPSQRILADKLGTTHWLCWSSRFVGVLKLSICQTLTVLLWRDHRCFRTTDPSAKSPLCCQESPVLFAIFEFLI